MSFVKFRNLLQKNFAEMTKDADRLFEIDIDKDEFWNLYLDSFPAGTNNIFRERREYDCSCCRHFIKSIGNAVVIKDNRIRTMWDFETGDSTYQPVVDALDKYLKEKAVTDMYVSKFSRIGTACNHEDFEGKILTWDHFFLDLPQKFVDTSYKSVADIQGSFRDARNVFKRSLDEISDEAVETVLELIDSNTLYRGAEWKNVLNKFLDYKKKYNDLSENEKELFAWEYAAEAGATVGKIRNHSIGVLLTDITDGVNLDSAVRRYESIVAPCNYKRPKAIFTKKMLEEAQKTVAELGYMNSLGRRHATLDDISVSNILFSNKDAQKRVRGVQNVFEDMMSDTKANPKKFSRVDEVSIEKFITDVLPGATSVEAYMENRFEPNLVSLIAPQVAESKPMFKWNNGFSWAYKGNLTDSNVKQNVKNAGGRVDGVLRFSIQWNEDSRDNCDLDAHCKEPGGFELYFGRGKKPEYSPTHGQLDVDIINPSGRVAVENITWDDKSRMKPGKYEFFVHQYSGSAKSGFRAEIEFDGQIYMFDYHYGMRSGQVVQVATVTLNKDGTFSIQEHLDSQMHSKELWGVKANTFVPVSVIMYSPNYWDGQNGVGNRHYMFMLKDCINDEEPNGFYNEFLKPELNKHKRVFEALGNKMAVESVGDQLSGIGFSSTKRNDLIVKVIGQTERVMKIKF